MDSSSTKEIEWVYKKSVLSIYSGVCSISKPLLYNGSLVLSFSALGSGLAIAFETKVGEKLMVKKVTRKPEGARNKFAHKNLFSWMRAL